MPPHFLTTVLECDPAWTKVEVLEALLLQSASMGWIAAVDVHPILHAMSAREALGSTGIGRGIAFPHTRHALGSSRKALFALCRPAVGFDSIDGDPVDIIVAMLFPTLRPDSTMKIDPLAEWLIGRFRDEEFLVRIRACRTPIELDAVLAGGNPP